MRGSARKSGKPGAAVLFADTVTAVSRDAVDWTQLVAMSATAMTMERLQCHATIIPMTLWMDSWKTMRKMTYGWLSHAASAINLRQR